LTDAFVSQSPVPAPFSPFLCYCADIALGQLWSLTSATLQARIRAQLNTVLFAKTLVRKDVASSAAVAKAEDTDAPESDAPAPDADGFSSKAQIMTLMYAFPLPLSSAFEPILNPSSGPQTSTASHGSHTSSSSSLVRPFPPSLPVLTLTRSTYADAPIEIAVGTIFLYNLLGVSCFFGLGVAILCLPLNHFAGKTISGALSSNSIPSRLNSPVQYLLVFFRSILNVGDGYRCSGQSDESPGRARSVDE
jgi:hypothetical protein